jgi:hypothetical protein
VDNSVDNRTRARGFPNDRKAQYFFVQVAFVASPAFSTKLSLGTPMPIGHPRLTITLSPRDTNLVLARCAATGDQAADYVTDLIRLDCDEAVGYFDSGADDFDDDFEVTDDFDDDFEVTLAAVASEMGAPP